MAKKKVFVSGCFDILHAGHLKLLYTAKSLGEKVYVGLDSDQRLKKYSTTKIINKIEKN